jgi:antitoxin component HigA of HigAB toxin-antitoxin module
MNLQRIEGGLSYIGAEASFILRINNEDEHAQALDLMEQLIEDYDLYEPLIDMLCYILVLVLVLVLKNMKIQPKNSKGLMID